MQNRSQFQGRPLSTDELRRAVPSAFAIEPWREMSSRYAFVPTINIIDGLRGAGFVPYSATQSLTRIPGKQDFTRHIIRFRNPDAKMTHLKQSIIEPVLINSHDGASLYDFSLGVWELACLNGLMVSTGSFQGLRIRHTGNIIQEVVDSAQHLIEQAPRLAETIGEWRNLQLSAPEQHLLAEQALSLRYDEGDVKPRPVEVLRPRRQEDSGSNLWNTFNRVQESLVNGGIRPRDERGNALRTDSGRRVGKTRAVTGITENVKLNRALWTLAEKMAELKKAS